MTATIERPPTRKLGRLTATPRARVSTRSRDAKLQQVTQLINDFQQCQKKRKLVDTRFMSLVREALEGRVWLNLKNPLTSWEEFCERHLGISRIRGIQIANQSKMMVEAEKTLGKAVFIKDKNVRSVSTADQKRVIAAAQAAIAEDPKKTAQVAIDEAITFYIVSKKENTKTKKKKNSDSIAAAKEAATDDQRTANEDADKVQGAVVTNSTDSNINEEEPVVTAGHIIEAVRDLKSMLDGFNGDVSKMEMETMSNEFPAFIETLMKLFKFPVLNTNEKQ